MKRITQIASLKAGSVKLKKIMAMIILFFEITGATAQRTLPTIDQFDYSPGPLQSVGVDWTRVSGSANDLLVTEGNITFNGYMIAKGRRTTLTNGASDDVKLSFTGQSAFGTTVYCAFVLDLQNTTGLSGTGVYCFILGFGVTNFAARTYIKSSGTGYQLGISKTTTVPSSWSAVLYAGTPHLVVMGYKILPGNSTDVASLWIDPVITTLPPPPDLTATNGVDFGSAASMDSFFLRQTPGSPNASVDDISISTDWADLFKNPVYTASGSIGTGTFNDLSVKGSATSLTLAANISVNGTLSLADATINLAGNTLSYGAGGILKYSGNISQTTTPNEFPSLNGPRDLIIDNPGGVILNLDRILAGSLTIKNGSKLTISPANTLTVMGSVYISGEESLIIRSDETGTGSLIDNGTIIGTGTAKIERYLTGYTDINDKKFHFISAPVSGQYIQPAFVSDPPGAGDDFYKWDEPSGTWINTKNNAGLWNTGFETQFETGKGYLASYPSDMIKHFTGALNTNSPASPITIICSQTDPGSGGDGGWNLLGNPYPSAIDWNLVSRGSGMDNALYYYDASAENYRYYIQYQGSALGNGSQYIPSMQGFMVHAGKVGDYSVRIDNTCRVHQSTGIFYKKSAYVTNMLKLKVEKDDQEDETFIFLSDEATPEFDGSYDAYKLPGLNPAVPMIYSITPGHTELSINSLPGKDGNLVVPIGFKAGTGGSYNMTADGMAGLDPGMTITVEDLKTGNTHDLMKNPAWSFMAEPQDEPERFLLHFSGMNGIDEQNQSDIKIFSNNYVISVFSEQKFLHGTVFLYALSGQELFRKDLDGNSFVSFPVKGPAGIYLVKFISDKNVKIEKVLIQ